jgi:hypothetical protein
MSHLEDLKIFRIIDANFNRAKEGLRVCEDVCRFLLDKKALTKNYKDIRHELTQVIGSLKFAKMIKARNIQKDVGKQSTPIEFKRKNVTDVFYANSQRVKESIRVLEEFSKLVNVKSTQDLKTLRYRVYAVEQKIIREL